MIIGRGCGTIQTRCQESDEKGVYCCYDSLCNDSGLDDDDADIDSSKASKSIELVSVTILCSFISVYLIQLRHNA